MTHSHDASASFKARDASSYDQVVGDFDRLVERFSSPLAERMISLARLSRSQRVLDVGTGTGLVALRAARSVCDGGSVLGIDLSEKMVETARLKASHERLSGCVDFRTMDAEALELEDQSFDVALSLFALLHFPNPLSALREMFRVLRPRGTLVVAVGSRPPLLSIAGAAHYLGRLPDMLLTLSGKRLVAPTFLHGLVRKHCPASDEPEESPLARESLNRTRRVLALVREAGFTKVRWYWQGHDTVVEAPEAFWDVQRTFSSFARKRITDAPADTVRALREEFLERCRRVQSRGGRLIYPHAAFYVAARRPPA